MLTIFVVGFYHKLILFGDHVEIKAERWREPWSMEDREFPPKMFGTQYRKVCLCVYQLPRAWKPLEKFVKQRLVVEEEYKVIFKKNAVIFYLWHLPGSPQLFICFNLIFGAYPESYSTQLELIM